MEKTKYRVYMRYKLCYTYVTTTRNCEDMLFQIREMHEMDPFVMFRVTRENLDGKEILIYSNRRDNRNRWQSELYN